MMGQFLRILIVLIGLWLVFRLVKRYLAKHRPTAPSPPAANDDVVPCAHCSVYVPRTEAIHAHGKTYCSRAHSEANS
jgi:uncharacterized protein